MKDFGALLRAALLVRNDLEQRLPVTGQHAILAAHKGQVHRVLWAAGEGFELHWPLGLEAGVGLPADQRSGGIEKPACGARQG